MTEPGVDALVVGGPDLGDELSREVASILGRPVGVVGLGGGGPDGDRLGDAIATTIAAGPRAEGAMPPVVVFAASSFLAPDRAEPADQLLLAALEQTLVAAASPSTPVASVVVLTEDGAADPTSGPAAVQTVAERRAVAAGACVIRLEPGAKGLDRLLPAALDPALGGRVLTGPGVNDDGTSQGGPWGADEIFVPVPVPAGEAAVPPAAPAEVWMTSPAPLTAEQVRPLLDADPARDVGPLALALVTPPEPAAAMSVLLSPPVVAGREHELVAATLDSGWLAPAGPQLDAFEAELSRWVDDQPVVALSSGTAALHLALVVAGIQPGDEVVVQSATFAASAFAVRHAGAVPVFCDIDDATGNLDPDLLAHHLEERARLGRLPAAVVAVDLYGCCADYDRLTEVCGRYELPLIQDAAESLGSRSQGVAAGTQGDLGVLSFNGNKIITTSGGGALTGPRHLIERARKLSTQAREPGLHYEHHELGYNFRLSGLLASVGHAQLETLPARLAAKARSHARYVEALPELGWFPTGVTEEWNHWLSVARLPRPVPPHHLCRALAAAGIESRPFWKPMHRQPFFQGSEAWLNGHADDWYAHAVCLPSGYSLTADQQDHVIEQVRRVIGSILG